VSWRLLHRTRGLDALAVEHGLSGPSDAGFRLELAVPESGWAGELAELVSDLDPDLDFD
jgi:hypothetical protein